MIWKTRTRTKIMTTLLIYIGILLGCIIGTWMFTDKADAPKMVVALLATGGGVFMMHLWTIMKENTGRKKDGE